mmetsp:Transcript_6626/g.24714  ORF Transcript_6626/g.24714 Transcript_6626/m.24714 type:complete len:219 (+) Transcript_6626:318-974(+)
MEGRCQECDIGLPRRSPALVARRCGGGGVADARFRTAPRQRLGVAAHGPGPGTAPGTGPSAAPGAGAGADVASEEGHDVDGERHARQYATPPRRPGGHRAQASIHGCNSARCDGQQVQLHVNGRHRLRLQQPATVAKQLCWQPRWLPPVHALRLLGGEFLRLQQQRRQLKGADVWRRWGCCRSWKLLHVQPPDPISVHRLLLLLWLLQQLLQQREDEL